MGDDFYEDLRRVFGVQLEGCDRIVSFTLNNHPAIGKELNFNFFRFTIC